MGSNYTNTLRVNKDTNNKGIKTHQYILFFYCSFTVHVKGTITANLEKSDSKMASLDKGACALTSEVSQKQKFAEPSSAVILALDESFDDDTDWHVDINIVLSINEVSQFIHVLGTRGT